VAIVAGFVVVLSVVPALFLDRTRAASRSALAAFVSAACLWGASTLSDVQFEYWDRRGRAHYRLGELEQALAGAEKADSYADPNCKELTDTRLPKAWRRCDRKREVTQLRAMIASRGSKGTTKRGSDIDARETKDDQAMMESSPE
jgi:hypothetical protein